MRIRFRRSCRKPDFAGTVIEFPVELARALYENIAPMNTSLKVLLYLGACICALASLWLVVCIFGLWFIGPPQGSMTNAQNILWRSAMTALLIGTSIAFAALVRVAVKKAGKIN